MKTYLGVKIIKAEKAPKGWNNEPTKHMSAEDMEEGYRVTYEDGYVSWSPKAVFEKAYRQIDNLTFGLAIEAMKQGSEVTRSGWNNTNISLKIQFPDKDSKMTEPYIYMLKYDKLFPVEVSCESMLAEDWVIVKK